MEYESSPLAERCPACGGALRKAFEITVLSDTRAEYHNCSECDSLSVVKPTWLDRSYAADPFPDPDEGALRRALFIHRVIRRMRAAGLLRRDYRSLDYGCGLGLLVKLQRDRGIDALGYDRYSQPKFAQLECHKELPNGQFDLVSAVEVIEHLTEPVQFLSTIRDLIVPDGVALITTELFDRRRISDPSRWHYVAPELGQHIMLFSPQGLARAAAQSGLRYVTSLVWLDTPWAHLLCRKESRISAARLAGLRLRNYVGESLVKLNVLD
jgi:2-polyprenyl-3-methyl-5-hydroxy-6-metoxy-1,4-benzoquinol methylase